MSMLTTLPFVFTGLQSWYVDIGSNARNMAEELSKTNDVLFVNPPIDRITVLRKGKDNSNRHKAIFGKSIPELQKVGDRLWVYTPSVVLESINWIPFKSIHDRANLHNNRLFADGLSKILRQLGWKDYVLLNDNEIMRCLHFRELLKPALTVYYIRDYLMGVPYWYKHGHRLEPKIMRTSDLVVANSPQLSAMAKKHNPHSYYIGQGCDVVKFQSGINAEIPEPLKGIEKPIIGYVGALVSWRLDIDLLVKIATSYPDYQLVLVGHEDEAFLKSALHGLSNVLFIPNQPEKLLPAYINAFDVCINPQLQNEITAVNYPRKIDEYLTVGKPTVATWTPTMQEVFGDMVFLAKTHEDYLRLLPKAIESDSLDIQTTRRNFAASHTWKDNIDALFQAINHSTNNA